MLEFVGGLALGAILGVVADRLWRKTESRVVVRIRGGAYDNYLGQEGFTLTVHNEGKSPLPPFRPCLFHPMCGSFFYFKADSEGELRPNQKRRYEWAILERGKVRDHHPNLTVMGDGTPIDPPGSGFVFRLVLENSDQVLYENARLGSAFVRLLLKVCEQKQLAITGIEMGELSSKPQSFLAWLWGSLKGTKDRES
jgi:hypothetical protein